MFYILYIYIYMYMDYYVYFATTIIIIYKLARKKKQWKVITCRYDIKVNYFWRLNILYSKKKFFISMFYRIIIICVSSISLTDGSVPIFCISIMIIILYVYLLFIKLYISICIVIRQFGIYTVLCVFVDA